MGGKEAYRTLCDKEGSVPLFLQPWWLDATCGEQAWDVALVTKGNEIHAALPYLSQRRKSFRVLSQPSLTPFLGPWLRNTGAKKANDYSRQKELMTKLIDALPPHDHYQQNWSPTITNWLPFYWRGFKQSTGYTYALPDLSDETSLWSGVRENIRTDIRKASGRFAIQVDAEASLDDFLRLNDLTFSRQGRSRPDSDAYLRKIDNACIARNCRKIFIARDSDGKAHAGAYIIWDANSAYYLMGGGDPALRNSGATSLCLWEAIRFASGVSHRFDFEGSMVEPIERFFRSFGAEQTPYFQISRTTSRPMATLMALRSLIAGS